MREGNSEVSHEPIHLALIQDIRECIECTRSQLGLEPTWAIEIRVCCPSELPQEASIWWDAEVFYARLHVRCTMWGKARASFLRWLILHELCELQMWRTGSAMHTVIEQVVPRGLSVEKVMAYQGQLRREWQRVRNQEIECRLYGLTGMRRPGHVLEGEEEQVVLEG